ncbi:putative transcription factor WD40-like family [Dioscorea sansibarensis]
MEPETATAAVPPGEGQAVAAAGTDEEARKEVEEEVLVARAQRLISKITATQANPNPKLIHALASMLEAQETSYIQQSGSSSLNNGRTSHLIGRLGSLVRETDEFYELISSKFLYESRYSISVRSASARLLLSCSSTWMFPHVFDDAVLDNIKSWVMEEPAEVSGDSSHCERESGRTKPTDAEMLQTYATGLLALSLAGGTQVVEDLLTSGLSAKLMHYLRVRIFGDAGTGQKDNIASDVRHGSSIRNKEESRNKYRQLVNSSRLDVPRIGDESLLGGQTSERDLDRVVNMRQAQGPECWGEAGEFLESEMIVSSSGAVGVCEIADEDTDIAGEGWHNREFLDGKLRPGPGERDSAVRNIWEDDEDENTRDDSSRRRASRGWPRTRGKGRTSEGTQENERMLSSPGSGLRIGGSGRGFRDRNQLKIEDNKRIIDSKKILSKMGLDVFATGEENDDRFADCNIGSKDISDLVKEATRAAEAEARTANGPVEAIKAAGDAAAELVKGAALEVWKATNDEDAAVLAASKAASTVVDAAKATENSRNSLKANEVLDNAKPVEPEADDVLDDFFILDDESLARLREKYCIQCLEILGQYVEALGPVLKEKGVDVCLAFLQRCCKDENSPDGLSLLPEVLKLICALAAHRKFATVFVDRGGIQKLLSTPRASQTFFGLSSCLFTIGSLQGVMERVCALPSDVVHQVVELALQLLDCPQDQARKNAAIFFATAFVFRAVLDSFDSQEGLQKMLTLLHHAASVRSGGNSGALGAHNANLRNDRSPAEVLTATEKQIAYHSCFALHQYFRAHLLLLVDSLRPNKSSRGMARSTTSARAAYKPLDISNEAMDTVFVQIQRDRKLGPALVRARWSVVDKFLASNGHIIMLELCQALPVERYLHDLAQYALGILHIVTFVPYSRKLIVNASLSNERVGMAVILDAASGAGYVDPEVIHPALNVLVNLVCPPPSISNKPSTTVQGQQSVSLSTANGAGAECRDRNGESNLIERGGSTPFPGGSSQTASTAMSAGVVGDRRISLGPGAGCAGLAAQLEQGYRQAREAVRANNGIKVLLHLLHPRMITPPGVLDCLRALACRVLLGLARDDTIAHILTKLQVGKKLSELIRDSSTQPSGTEMSRWHTELAQVAIELIAIVTNSGRASTLAATDAAAPTLRRIERAAIAAATPITYHSRELLLLIHEHLQLSGFAATAALLKKEADLTPLPSLGAPPPPLHQVTVQEGSSALLQWPSGRSSGFSLDTPKPISRDEDVGLRSDLVSNSFKKKSLSFSSSLSQSKSRPPSLLLTASRPSTAINGLSVGGPETPSISAPKSTLDIDHTLKSPILLPMKRKLTEFKDIGPSSPSKRLATVDLVTQSPICQTPSSGRKNHMVDYKGQSPSLNLTPQDSQSRLKSSVFMDHSDETLYGSTFQAPMTSDAQIGLHADSQPGNVERMTLDSLVVQYLKHQHRQCPAPITTLPPLSLLHPHVCPEPSRSLNAPSNVTSRVSSREFLKEYGQNHARRRDRQFVYSRFKPFRTCRDEPALLSCVTFLGDSSRIATGSQSGELKIFDTYNGNLLESQSCHQSLVTLVQSAFSGGMQLILSSSIHDVRLWDASSISSGPLHSFDGCKAAQFSHSGIMFAAFSPEASRREVLLYDIQTYNLEQRFSDSSNTSGRGHTQSLIHFSPSDTMLLWNGILWDRRSSGPVHRFDQFTDYGGGGFHPAGNEVILNSEVWDLRKFKLLRSVPSLDQTVITFNSTGDVIYAILRRNLEDVTSAVHTRRVRHTLFPAFRTVDAVNYSDIATVQLDRCVLDLATEPNDSFVGVVAMDDHEDLYSSARLYEIGRRRRTDDDSDPDDGPDTDEEEDDENDDSDVDADALLGPDLDGEGDSDSDDLSNDEDDDSVDEADDDVGDFNMDGQGLLEIVTEGDEDDDSEVLESLGSEDEGDFVGNGFGF